MKIIIGLMLALIIGCEGDRISHCGYACKDNGTKMVSYDNTNGCKCTPPSVPCYDKDGGK